MIRPGLRSRAGLVPGISRQSPPNQNASAAHATILIAAATLSLRRAAARGASSIFLVLIVIFYFIYRFFMRPRQRAAQAQRDTLMTLEPGDEVLTGAGIFGTVQHVQGDRVTLWTGTGSTITVLRRTIARKLEEDDMEQGTDDEHEADHHDTWDDDDAAELEKAHHEHVGEPDTDGHPMQMATSMQTATPIRIQWSTTRPSSPPARPQGPPTLQR